MNYGYVKVAAAVPAVKVANCKYNATQIEQQILIADGKGVQVVVFPELSMTGATAADLLLQPLLIDEAERGLLQVLGNTRQLDIISIIGMPVALRQGLVNAAVVVQKGKVLGVVPKTYLLGSDASDSRRFVSASDLTDTSVRLCGQVVPVGFNLLFDAADALFGIELSDDLRAPLPPSTRLALSGADIVFNLSACVEHIGSYRYLCSLLSQQSARCRCGYVLSACGFGESTTDGVYGGSAFICESGTLLAASERFSLTPQLVVSDIDVDYLRHERRTDPVFTASCARCSAPAPSILTAEPFGQRQFTLTRTYSPHPFVPDAASLDERCDEVFSIQVSGLAQRLLHTHAKTAVIGISGGLDSTLALLVAVRTFDKLGLNRAGIIGITMPGFGTTDRTYTNAMHLMQSLGITIREVSIKEACLQHFADIGHDAAVHDVVYENSQARERTQILMDIANQTGGMVVGTGDLSELALGWATYNGDHMSMYGVNAGVPKTLVQHLVRRVALSGIDSHSSATLLDIVDTPISPELIPADDWGNIRQITEDLVGPYELHDFFLYYFLRCGFRPSKIFFLASRTFAGTYADDTIRHWLTTFIRRFFNQQFKRSCLPDGPRVGTVSLSPRGAWLMPSDADSEAWLRAVEAE